MSKKASLAVFSDGDGGFSTDDDDDDDEEQDIHGLSERKSKCKQCIYEDEMNSQHSEQILADLKSKHDFRFFFACCSVVGDGKEACLASADIQVPQALSMGIISSIWMLL